MNTRDFCLNIKNLCKKNNITLQNFCYMTNISKETLQGWWNRSGSPNLQQIEQVANFFGVSIEIITKANGSDECDCIKPSPVQKPDYSKKANKFVVQSAVPTLLFVVVILSLFACPMWKDTTLFGAILKYDSVLYLIVALIFLISLVIDFIWSGLSLLLRKELTLKNIVLLRRVITFSTGLTLMSFLLFFAYNTGLLGGVTIYCSILVVAILLLIIWKFVCSICLGIKNDSIGFADLSKNNNWARLIDLLICTLAFCLLCFTTLKTLNMNLVFASISGATSGARVIMLTFLGLAYFITYNIMELFSPRLEQSDVIKSWKKILLLVAILLEIVPFGIFIIFLFKYLTATVWLSVGLIVVSLVFAIIANAIGEINTSHNKKIENIVYKPMQTTSLLSSKK